MASDRRSRKAKAQAQAQAPKRRSIYRGVVWSKGRWKALISTDDRNLHLGIYATEEEAARAYDDKAKQLRDNPVLNFLPDGSPNPDRKSKYVYRVE